MIGDGVGNDFHPIPGSGSSYYYRHFPPTHSERRSHSESGSERGQNVSKNLKRPI